MIQPGDHLADQFLSAALDDQLTPDEARQVSVHLATCSICEARLDQLGSVVQLLRALPSLPAPRDFSLGPRLVADPPNVVRLRRWYGVARAGAASLAAVFVFLSAGAFYIDSQPVELGKAGSALLAPAAPGVERAPAAQNAAAATAPAVRTVAPAVAPVPAPPASAGAPAAAARPADSAPGAARAQPAPTPPGAGAADQVTAATSVRALPTPVPTPAPVPTLAPQRVPEPIVAPRPDAAAPLKAAAATVGLLAAMGLLATLVIRYRLRTMSSSPTE